MKNILFAVVTLLLLAVTGCQSEQVNRSESKPAAEEKKKLSDFIKKEDSLSDEESKQTLQELNETIRDTFTRSGELNGWGSDNPANYEEVGPEFNKIVTERFSEKQLKFLIPEYYCECDAGYLPAIDYQVRLEIKEKSHNKIIFSAIEPSNDMTDGSQWFFTLVKVEDTWKMDNWKSKPLRNASKP